MHTELATVPDFTLQRHSRQPGDCGRSFFMPQQPASLSEIPSGEFTLQTIENASQRRSLLSGTALGILAFLMTMSQVPTGHPDRIITLDDINLSVVTGFGFLYAPIVSIWTAAAHYSLKRIIAAILFCAALGFAFYRLSNLGEVVAVAAVPVLVGGLPSALWGRPDGDPLRSAAIRFCKGLVAGFALILMFWVLLAAMAVILSQLMAESYVVPTRGFYTEVLWRGGTLAMAVSSGVFFVMLQWSANLNPRARMENEQIAEPELPKTGF